MEGSILNGGIYYSSVGCSWYNNSNAVTTKANILAPKTGTVTLYCNVICMNIYKDMQGTLSGFNGQINETVGNCILIREVNVTENTNYELSITVQKGYISKKNC